MSDSITITGNIATDPNQITTPNGAVITRFRLASSHRRRDASGEWVDGHTNWYTVCAYRHLGANAYASFRKGERVIVSGRLRLRRWEQEDKRGMEAEFDADALGHDLQFGTSSYARVAREQAATTGVGDQGGSTGAGQDAPAGGAARDDWANPAAGVEARTPEAEAVPF